ncbi:MAG: hypothetical protein JXA62_07700 [Candidatus Aminicenantes bacterium]|nr:hypothetical protein [Candidatus Aminicenantes bacterium]
MSNAKNSSAAEEPVVLNNGIFVAGHPRSGTSLACKLLESAGVHFPSDLNADHYNRDGYFELAEAKELEKDLIRQAMTTENVAVMNRVVRLLNNTRGLSGLKVVHIPALFFYRHICKNIRAVLIFRHPADVYSSMLRRGISSFHLDWFANNNALVAAHENIPKSIVISYESLIQGHPRIREAFQRLGFSVDVSVIKRSFRTQAGSRLVLTEPEQRLYRLLQKLERNSLRSR